MGAEYVIEGAGNTIKWNDGLAVIFTSHIKTKN
jgi:hypothetical protein